jgi:TonB family protein
MESSCSHPDSPSTAGKRFDLVGTVVTRIFRHCNLSVASTCVADGGNRKKTALLLKASRIGGVVRLKVSISPGGVVQSVSPLGGSPPLVDTATTAVKKWKYEPAFGWTNIEVRLRFTPICVGALLFRARSLMLALGCLAQTWDANSLPRCDSKFRFASSKDLPVGAPEGLKTHAHSEQPQPRKRSCSIHTSLRRAAIYRRKTKSRLTMFLFTLSSSLTIENHSVHLSGPPTNRRNLLFR